MGVIQIRLLEIKQLSLSIGIGSSHIHMMPPFPRFKEALSITLFFDLTTIRRSTLFDFQRMNDIVSLDENINLFCVRITKNGKIRAYLEKQGTPIGPLDTMIAGHAKSLDYVLVTNNTKEFSRVQDLKLENWAE